MKPAQPAMIFGFSCHRWCWPTRDLRMQDDKWRAILDPCRYSCPLLPYENPRKIKVNIPYYYIIMDGLFQGKPYEQMGWFGDTTIFWKDESCPGMKSRSFFKCNCLMACNHGQNLRWMVGVYVEKTNENVTSRCLTSWLNFMMGSWFHGLLYIIPL